MTNDLASVSKPKQARSQRTLERILDAAEGLIEERGFADLTISEVVRRAGSSVGGFYGRFRDKDELLLALHERFVQRTRERMAELAKPERWRDEPLRGRIHAALEEVVRVYGAHQPLVAAVVALSVRHPEMCQAALSFRAEAIQALVALVLTRREEIAHPEPRRAAELGAQMLFALMDQSVIFGEVRAGGETLTGDALLRELERAFLSYLGSTWPE